MKYFKTAIIYVLFCLFVLSAGLTTAKASGGKEMKKVKTAIVLAFFGSTYPSGIKAVKNITDHVRKAFPNTVVKITFTSNIIRKIWRERQKEANKWIAKGIPEEVIYVKGILSTMDELQERNYKNIIVQSTHIYHMEQVQDLLAYIKALRCIETVKEKWKPFKKIVFGRPIFGGIGDKYDYHKDLETGIRALKDDVELARKKNAILVYMAHGNEYWSSGIYKEAEEMFRKLYPDVQVFIGVVEGYPGIYDILKIIKTHSNKKRIILKPFMVVAGDHAHNDMASDEPDSWKSILEKNGFEVLPVFEGLGEKNTIAEIIVQHIKDAAKEANLKLE